MYLSVGWVSLYNRLNTGFYLLIGNYIREFIHF